MPFLVQNLRIYRESPDLAGRVTALTESCPRGRHYPSDQLNRAGVSVAANIAEGNGHFLPKDRRNFFVIGRASAQECLPLLEVAKRRDLNTEQEHTELIQGLEVILRMVPGLIQRADVNQRASSP
jgi:four helix bundle protein